MAAPHGPHVWLARHSRPPGVKLYNRIDHAVFGNILVGAMAIGGVAYVAHAGSSLLEEAWGHHGRHVGWLFEYFFSSAATERLVSDR